MQEITMEHEKRVKANKKLQCEVEGKKDRITRSRKIPRISEVVLYSLERSNTLSQPTRMYRGSSLALVKSITINSRPCKFLSSISITLRQFFVYQRAMLTSSS